MDLWKHGKYIDMWSIVHFLSGVLLAGLFVYFKFEFWFAFVATLIVLIGWEIVEWITKIIEPSANVAVDLIVGLAGFLVSSYICSQNDFDLTNYLILLGLTGLLALWGFIDFKKRGYR